MSPERSPTWGWRIPFLLSIILLGVLDLDPPQLDESPAFTQMKAEGKGSKSPLTRRLRPLGQRQDRAPRPARRTAGQAVVWYTGQFYALFFLTQTLKLDCHDGQHR